MKRDIYFWLAQARGWLLLFYLIDAQAIPTFSNDRCVAVAMGRQELVEQITGQEFPFSLNLIGG
jgi:hypothetical protein